MRVGATDSNGARGARGRARRVYGVLPRAAACFHAPAGTGWSALHHAARAGDSAVCALLLGAGAGVDTRTAAPDRQRRTPLTLCLELCDDRKATIRLCCALVRRCDERGLPFS